MFARWRRKSNDKITIHSDAAAPAPVAHQVPLNTTSTLQRKIVNETSNVVGLGGKYNPDVDPLQHPLIKAQQTNIEDPRVRERLLEYSEFLRGHSYEQIEDIMVNGWQYEPEMPEKTAPVWTPKFTQLVIDAVAKALVIDTAFLCEFETESGDPAYRVFTHNDVDAMYGDESRIPTEVYFQYPTLPDLFYEKGEGSQNFARQIVGFLTQHVPPDVKQREGKRKYSSSRLLHPQQNKPDEVDATLYRKCVMIQPKETVRSAFGEPYLKRQCMTAMEKLYLRFYEMLYMHKGGVHRTVAFQEGQDEGVKNALVTEAKRGMCSRGLVYSVKAESDKSISDLMMTVENPIPDLNFQTISSHISEDAMFSKQAVEGQAATGALGGQAPVVNDQNDKETMTHFQAILAGVIKDINDVFFDVDPDVYDIKFNPKVIMADTTLTQQAGNVKTMEKRDYLGAKAPSPNAAKASNADMADTIGSKANAVADDPNEMVPLFMVSKAFMTPPAGANVSPDIQGNETPALAHAITDEFQVYKGNLFEAGAYYYPENPQKPYDIFTKEDIRHFANREVRQGYLEFDHSFNDARVGLDEGVGHYETVGYDEATGKDVTMFYVRKDRVKDVPDPTKIKVSPYFHTAPGPSGRRIFLRNAAIVVHGRPRAELTGLHTEAEKV